MTLFFMSVSCQGRLTADCALLLLTYAFPSRISGNLPFLLIARNFVITFYVMLLHDVVCMLLR